MREHPLAVQASVSADGGPQAAVVGIVVTEELEVFFDTDGASRKTENLRRDPRIAFVIGGMGSRGARSVQYEGIADEPAGPELRRLKELYFEAFPDGREREAWPGIVYLRARPMWIRYSDFERDPPEIFELGPAALGLEGHS